MKNTINSDKEGGKKISRLQFLKLLGVGAIAYFAYRAGFISSLFRNATAAEGGGGWVGLITPPPINLPPSSGWVSAVTTTAGLLDEDGILMMAAPKSHGYSYNFNPAVFPSTDIRLDTHDTGGFELKQEGGVKFIRFTSHNPGTGEGGNTVRLHVFTENRSDDDKQRYTWIDGAQEMGWLTHP
jgi:hypothetical protein